MLIFHDLFIAFISYTVMTLRPVCKVRMSTHSSTLNKNYLLHGNLYTTLKLENMALYPLSPILILTDHQARLIKLKNVSIFNNFTSHTNQYVAGHTAFIITVTG